MRQGTAELLREAVTAGAYGEAERLLAAYRGEMQAAWDQAHSRKQREVISAEVGDLLQWARSATLAARAHAQGKLIHLLRRRTYEA